MSSSHPSFALPLVPKKEVCLDWDGGELSSDGGWLLLSLADQQLRLTARLAAAVEDLRDPNRLDHPLEALFRQRCFQIAQGYEDGNDAQTLRFDPLLKVAVGRAPSAPPLAGQSTFSRFENAATAADLDRLEAVLQQSFVERIAPGAKRVVLDLDPYDDPAHGQQQGVLFNGYYDEHCYLPLLFCGTVDDGPQRLIGVVLRGGTAAPTEEAMGFLEDLVPLIRAQHPEIEILVRGDSAYGVPVMITCCRKLKVGFCFGKARNAALLRLAAGAQARAEKAEALRAERGRRRRALRVFDNLDYRAGDWKRSERVVVKWEITYGSANPRFVVTDLETAGDWNAHQVYAFYCQRGDRENRIKEFKLDMSGARGDPASGAGARVSQSPGGNAAEPLHEGRRPGARAVPGDPHPPVQQFSVPEAVAKAGGGAGPRRHLTRKCRRGKRGERVGVPAPAFARLLALLGRVSPRRNGK